MNLLQTSILLICCLSYVYPYSKQSTSQNHNFLEVKVDKEKALQKLRTYLKINTSPPTSDYSSVIRFLKEYAKEIGLEFKEYRCTPSDPPNVILTWKGKDPDAASIILNSHTDMVPAPPEGWKYPPFNATLSRDDQERDIVVGRGSQDRKFLGIMYLESLRYLVKMYPQGPLRTVFLTFVPEEETGGVRGLKCMSESPEFEVLFGIIGLVLDEGLPILDDRVWAYYGERVQEGFKNKAQGNSGHGSQFLTNLATDKLALFESKARRFRYTEQRKLKGNNAELGDVTTINLNVIHGGTAVIVVPVIVEAWFDVRTTPFTDLQKLRNTFQRWAVESNVTLTFKNNGSPHLTNLTENIFWPVLQKSAKKFGLPITPGIFPVGTDSRYLRLKGIPAIRLTPINHHPIQAHAIGESLQLDSFYRGVEFYLYVLPSLFNFSP